VGTISRPIAYRTNDQKEAVRILFYKGRTSPHQASLADDWQRIQTATLNEKRERALQRWFDKARQDVFISIDTTYNFCGILNE
jgi:peptidyl-prolyl cis-trans isomerase SurA